MSEQQSAQQQAYAQHLQQERAALVKAIPEWAEPDKFAVGQKALSSYLQSQGFSVAEVESAADHRVIAMAEKARKWDENQKAGGAAKQKVVKIAKRILAPGSKPSRQDATIDEHAELRQALRKTGKERDAAALISAQRKSRETRRR